MKTRLTTQLYSDSMLTRMIKTEHPLLMALAKHQSKTRNKTTSRAFTVTKKSMVSFLPKGKEPVWGEHGGWAKKNRQETKIGSALRELAKMFDITAKDSEFEQATYCLQAQVVAEKAPEFELVRGPMIETYYRYGPPMGSCMSGKKDAVMKDYGFDLYTSNPEHIALLVLHGKSHKPEDILAKAMVMFDAKGQGYMNRVYYTKDVYVKVFGEYAKEMGWKQRNEWKEAIIPLKRHSLFPIPSLDGWSFHNGICLTYNMYDNKVLNDLIKEKVWH